MVVSIYIRKRSADKDDSLSFTFLNNQAIMYPVNQLQSQAVAVLCAVIVFIFYYIGRKLFSSTHIHKPGKTAPEPAGAWPIIGHLHLLGGSKLIYRTLGSLADEYGPVFMVRLGMRRVLVISNTESARECFTTNDKVFATRPTTVAVKLLTYNHTMFGFAPYGPYWREIRKIATTELLSERRLAMLKTVWISEINLCINELHQLWMEKNNREVDHHQHVYNQNMVPISVEMNGWFADLSFNVVARMIAGKRYFGKKTDGGEEETRRYREAMNDFMHLIVIFVVSDAVPFLGGLDFQGYKKRMKKTAKEIDYFLGKWVDEHRQRLKYKKVSKADQQDDFIDVLLLNLNDQPIYGRDTDTVIKSTCLSLIAGGSDTTAVTLTWALSLLLNNRDVLRKAQEELDIHVGRERQVEESDIKNLVYLQAIVKETFRLYPAAPLSAPRMAMEDCTVAGFQVTKGTQLMLNIWKLHRDPHFWGPDTLEFRPERFLNANSSSTGSAAHSIDIDVKGRHYELLPFGSGRRMCPGVSFAMQVVHLTLATLLQGFHLSTPTDGPVDMTETSGLSCPKATPLEVLLTPRLPFHVFCDLAGRCNPKVEHNSTENK